jgi:hypothetical protein
MLTLILSNFYRSLITNGRYRAARTYTIREAVPLWPLASVTWRVIVWLINELFKIAAGKGASSVAPLPRGPL